ncbi:hypothetical protein D3218_13165 [Aureimonas flava]|uniref:Uncharacterized protein n=1 Tax=Aureimonas flava TaxID=2320271 RepID=A0A3A1WK16_9HYPH|nr:hypothetical protein [Aureimonas flava]RIY00229.1 hypothetical protein D3218_13165 [Aureimonas flava]
MTGERYKRIAQPGDCKPGLQAGDHDGWLLLDGRTIRRAAYPYFFTKLKLPGDEAVLPDVRDRLLMGAGGRLNVGEKGGSSTLTLTADHLPAHRHATEKVTASATQPQKALLTGIGVGDVTKPPTVSIAAGGAETGEVGGGIPIDLPTPPHLALAWFVFTGQSG